MVCSPKFSAEEASRKFPTKRRKIGVRHLFLGQKLKLGVPGPVAPLGVVQIQVLLVPWLVRLQQERARLPIVVSFPSRNYFSPGRDEMLTCHM